jgi:hypothetical protein
MWKTDAYLLNIQKSNNLEKNNFFKSKIFFGILSFVIPFVVYIKTLAPSVSFIDTGELATVCIRLGIAHPTGYPLFTILGRLFSLLPFGEEIYRLSFMCAVASSAALVMLFNLLVFIFKDFDPENYSREKKQNNSIGAGISDLSIYILSLASVLTLGFSVTYWNIANSLEVYSFHQFFIVAIIFTMLKAVNETGKKESRADIYWILFAFLLGLSFGNHLSTIFMSLGCLYLYFAFNKFDKVSFIRIAIMAVPFILAFSVYIYFPVRADNPALSWGYPANWNNFVRHITGKQFSVWMFSSTEVTSKQFNYFVSSYPKEFFYIPLIVAVFGVLNLFNEQRKLFYFTFLLFAFNIFYAINYDIHDIDSYFILAYIVSAIWIAMGISFFVSKFSKAGIQIAILSFILAILTLNFNYSSNDESKNYFVKDYTENVYKSAKPNALIISSQWDFFVAASFYFQNIKGLRPDITIIDKELLRRSWYIRHIQIHFPEIYERSKNEFETFYVELLKFEKETSRYTNPKTDFDRSESVKINSAFITLLNSLVDKNYSDHPIYTTFEIENAQGEKFAKEYVRIPEGVLIRVFKNYEFYSDFTEPELVYSISKEKDYYHSFIMNAYYNYYIQRANLLMNKSKFDTAENLLAKALEIQPNDRTANQLIAKIKQLKDIQK